MALRSFIPLLVVIALQAFAGCSMPEGGVVGNGDNLHASKAERDARDTQLRKQVGSGSLGLAQLFPGGTTVDARALPPLQRPSAVIPVAVVSVPAARARATETPQMQPMLLASSSAAAVRSACDYKPVMSDADIEACR